MNTISHDSSSSPTPYTCPVCGHQVSTEVPGVTKTGECPRCGVIFDKIKSPEEKSKHLEPNQKIGVDKPSPKSGLLSRHKWTVTFTTLLVLAVIMAVLLFNPNTSSNLQADWQHLTKISRWTPRQSLKLHWTI